MPPRPGDVLTLARDAAEGGFTLQEWSPDRGTGLAVGAYPDLPTALLAASLWIAAEGDPEQFRRTAGARNLQTRRLQTRFGLRPETAGAVARLAFGGGDDQ